MDKLQKHQLQTFRRVRDFLRRNGVAVRFAKLDAQLEALDGVVDRLTAHSVEQDTRMRLAKSGTSTVARQVRQLRLEYMAPLSRFGRTLAPNDSALKRALTIPRKTDAEGTVAAALGMADAAESQKGAFVAGGFAADFAEQLRQVARVLKATIDHRAQHIGRRNASTAGVREEMAKGRSIIALLDAMIAPALEATPSLLTEWRTLKKQVRPGTSALPPDSTSVAQTTPDVPVPPIGGATETSRNGVTPFTPEVIAA